MLTNKKIKIDNSLKFWKTAQELIPCGTQTLSKAPNQFATGVYPIYLQSGQGSHVWDVDGNEFIDYPLGLGAVILGYNYSVVNEAVRKQMDEGIIFSLMHPLEIKLSELICRIVPCAEMVRFAKTGSEANQAAIRIARAYTKRKKIAVCGYHGWHDWYVGATPRSKGVPKEICDLVLTFEYNNPASLEDLFRKNRGEIAGVILEPVGLFPPQNNFLQKVKDLTHQNGALLIFDEIITGFRISLGGAQEYYQVVPDLTTMGKGIANGMPLSILCGKRTVMKTCEDIFFSSTFGGETASLAAAIATISELERKQVIPFLWRQGEKLLKALNAEINRLKLSAEVIGFGPRQFVKFFDSNGNQSLLFKAIFWQECIKRGILFGNAQFISFSHSDLDIERTISAAKESLEYVSRAISSGRPTEWYEGEIPVEIFRKVE